MNTTPVHVYFIFVSNIFSRIDDDLYTLYGALVGSQDTLLLTNDHLNDKTKLVSNDCMAVLEKWKKMRLVRVNHGHDVNGKTVLTVSSQNNTVKVCLRTLTFFFFFGGGGGGEGRG